MKWVPREANHPADTISKIVDFDDYAISDWVFTELDIKWGPHTVDVVLISDSPSDTSPVQLIKLYLSRLQIPDNCNKFIFRPSVKSKSSHSLIAIGRHISYSSFREHLKSDLFGLESSTIRQSSVSHSLRSGGATRAANTGIEERLIQRHGRWRSASSKNMYMVDVYGQS